MLARANRVTRPTDFRTIVRAGRRFGAPHLMIHIIDRGTADPARFGFIVGKNVGNAVTRNAIRRRLRAISRDLIPELGAGRDVVIRALPGSSATPWSILHSEIAEGIERSVSRR